MLDFLSKIILSLMFSIIIISSSNSNEIDCTKYKKLSTEYMECNAQKLKKKVSEGIKTGKKDFEENELTKKFKKFKNSKTLSELGKN